MHETSGANHLLEMQEHSAKRMGGISNQQTIPMLPKIRYWRWILNFNKCGALLTLTAILLLCSLMDSYSWSTWRVQVTYSKYQFSKNGVRIFEMPQKWPSRHFFTCTFRAFSTNPRVKVSRYWGCSQPDGGPRLGTHPVPRRPGNQRRDGRWRPCLRPL